MPNRIIKDSIHTSERLNALSDFQFRLWVSLITYVDDFGRGDARPAVIRGTCFPLRDRITNRDIEAALTALAGAGCVSLYNVDGKPYLYFPNWESHQSIRNKRSRFPAPDTCTQLQAIEINCNQTQANVPVIQSNPNPNPKENPNSARATGARSAKAHPTREEVREYCRQRNSPVDPDQFFDYFEAGNWKDSEGKPVLAWKQKLLTWEKNERSRHSSKPASERGSKPADFNDLDKMLDKI